MIDAFVLYSLLNSQDLTYVSSLNSAKSLNIFNFCNTASILIFVDSID